MKSTTRRRIRRTIAGCFLLTLAGLTMAFALRSHIATHVARIRLERLAHSHGLQAGFNNLSVEGLSTIHLDGLWAATPSDTLFSLQRLDVKLRFLPLLRQNLEVETIAVDSLLLRLPQQGHALETSEALSTSPEQATDYVRQSRRFVRLLFDLLPANATLSRIHCTHTTDSLTLQVILPRMELRQYTFDTQVNVTENNQQQRWHLQGIINPDERQLQLSAVPSIPAHTPLPYLSHRLHAEVSFDSLSIGLHAPQEDDTPTRLTLSGGASLHGLCILQPRLSPMPIVIDSTSTQFTLHILPTALQLDSCSTLRLNLLDLHPYLLAERIATPEAQRPDASWHFTLSLHKPWFPSQQLFSSLPRGLFSNLQGLRTRGELAYDLHFDLDLTRPDSLQLYSALHRRHFAIEQYGATPLNRMTDEFLYTAYEQGEPVRTFPVGPSWEHFTPLSQVQPILLTAILQSEDGGFFHHQGFLPDALREALAYDIKAGRFARGGSTISMQLVKNVFLSREKNLARKLEEALIVWLIEGQRLTSKERMLEVYLNIAEWGPMIYGLREAAHYYFAKPPQALTTEESIFLATIIPRPKHWMWSFTPEGTLRDSQEAHFRLLAERLVAKGLLTPTQAEAISIHNLHLQGPAASYFQQSSHSTIQE